MLNKPDKILIAEDDLSTQLILTRFVEQLGAEAICAENGQQALDLAAEADLVLLDAQMPVMDGFTCAEQLSRRFGDQLPVLIVTALEDEESINRAFAAGAIDYIAKPVNWTVLRHRINYLLKARKNRLALQLSEARKSALIEQAADAIINIRNDNAIVEFNPAAETLFEYSKDQACEQLSIEQLIPEYPLLKQRMLRENNRQARYESAAISRCGRCFVVEITFSEIHVRTEYLTTLTLHDISERKHFEQQQKLAATVFDSCNEGILITDASNIIEAVNPSFTDITGFSAEEALGRAPDFLNSGQHDKAFYAGMWRQIRQSGGWQGEVINQHKSGEQRYIWMSIRTVNDSKTGQLKNHVAVFSDITARKRAEQKVWWQANHDSLTLLPNRNLFMHTLSEQIANKQSCQLMFIDLDGFKAVNDTYGHQAGDKVLQEAANRLIQLFLQACLIARLGGDEFVVLLAEDDSDPKQLTQQGEQLVASLSAPFAALDGKALISASVGVARYPENAGSTDELISLADHLMYQVKANGKSGVIVAQENSTHPDSLKRRVIQHP